MVCILKYLGEECTDAAYTEGCENEIDWWMESRMDR